MSASTSLSDPHAVYFDRTDLGGLDRPRPRPSARDRVSTSHCQQTQSGAAGALSHLRRCACGYRAPNGVNFRCSLPAKPPALSSGRLVDRCLHAASRLTPVSPPHVWMWTSDLRDRNSRRAADTAHGPPSSTVAIWLRDNTWSFMTGRLAVDCLGDSSQVPPPHTLERPKTA